MSDIKDPHVLQQYILIQEQVQYLHTEFLQLGNHLSEQFNKLQDQIIKEGAEARMGATFSRAKTEPPLSDGRMIEDRLDGTRDEIRELKEAVEAAEKERKLEISERLRMQHEYEIKYNEWEGMKKNGNACIDELRVRNDQLEASVKDLDKNRGLAIEHLEKLVAQNQVLEGESAAMKDEMTTLQEQTIALRGMLTKNGGHEGNQMDDNTIVRSFASIREQVQRIAHKFCPTKPFELTFSRSPTGQRLEFFKFWAAGNLPKRRNLMRAKIFEIIQDEILQRKNFGMDDFFEGSGGNEKLDLERSLHRFETALMGLNPGSEAATADWRVRTLHCASLLKLANSRAKKTAALIQGYVDPLWSCSRPNEAEGASADVKHLAVLLERVCEEAFEFAMLLRSSRDSYRCELPARRSPLGEDSEPQSREPSEGGSSTDQDIAYALAPALVKYPLTDPKKRLILEKAHVVVF
ncbi:uncharacterized protein RCO7_07518 [Rhynchosporium graminicola]|uniref:Uncharacterized protein n=1 Tax=Rhynchosporium graminicola TaxID=2792576 RepID=A0A1E1LJ78_9HELO|nr:uncharacterized protein RCO7_07518 [Rhynchosporium commune]